MQDPYYMAFTGKPKLQMPDEDAVGAVIATIATIAIAAGIVTALGLWTHAFAMAFGAWLHKRLA